MTQNETLRARLAHVEDRLERIEQAETATDDDGREWSVPQLVEMGLTRRQAMLAVGSLAVYGGSIWAAIKHATGNARAATDQVGTPSQPVDVFADTVDTVDRDIGNLGVGVRLDGNQTIPTGSVTQIEFPSAQIDGVGEFDSSTDTATIDTPGDYRLRLQVSYSSLADQAQVLARITINSTNYDVYGSVSGSNPGGVSNEIPITLSAGDTVEAHTYQDSGSDGTLNDATTNLIIERWSA